MIAEKNILQCKSCEHNWEPRSTTNLARIRCPKCGCVLNKLSEKNNVINPHLLENHYDDIELYQLIKFYLLNRIKEKKLRAVRQKEIKHYTKMSQPQISRKQKLLRKCGFLTSNQIHIEILTNFLFYKISAYESEHEIDFDVLGPYFDHYLNAYICEYPGINSIQILFSSLLITFAREFPNITKVLAKKKRWILKYFRHC